MTKREIWNLLSEDEQAFMRELKDTFDIILIGGKAND